MDCFCSTSTEQGLSSGDRVGYPKEMEEDQGHFFGGNVMFAKPYDIKELLAEVKKQLQLHCSI